MFDFYLFHFYTCFFVTIQHLIFWLVLVCNCSIYIFIIYFVSLFGNQYFLSAFQVSPILINGRHVIVEEKRSTNRGKCFLVLVQFTSRFQMYVPAHHNYEIYGVRESVYACMHAMICKEISLTHWTQFKH
jgi:hypothetical protein